MGKVEVEPGWLDVAFRGDPEELLDKFEDVLCDEPGLMGLVELEIDMGYATPIHQNAYNMPVSVMNKEQLRMSGLRVEGISGSRGAMGVSFCYREES